MPFKRGKMWYLDYMDETGRRIRTPYSTSKEVAEKEEKERKRRMTLFRSDITPLDKIAWDDFKYLLKSLLYPKRKSSTVLVYRKFISLVEESIKPQTIADVTPPKVEQMRLKCLKNGVGPYAMERYIKGGFAIFNWAYKNDLCEKIEWKAVENTHLKTSAPFFLTVEEFKDVLNQWNPETSHVQNAEQLYLFALMCRRMMLRPSEGFFARCDLLDIERGEYRLADDKSAGFNVKVQSYRTIPVPRRLLSYLVTTVKPKSQTPYILEWYQAPRQHSLNKGRPMGKNTFFKHVSKALTEAGYPDATAYSFRHTGATHMVVKDRESLSTTGKIMGHKNQSTTQIYVHPVTDDMRRAIEKLEDEEYGAPSVSCSHNCSFCNRKSVLVSAIICATKILKS